MLNEEVRKIMSKDPIVVHPNDEVEQVSQMMVDKRIQQIPVVKEGKLVGLVTSYDLWKDSRSIKGEKTKCIKDVMTTNVLTIAPKDKLGTAAELFMDRRFKTLPVVNLNNDFKGVITAFDVIKHTLVEEYPRPILYKEVIEGT